MPSRRGRSAVDYYAKGSGSKTLREVCDSLKLSFSGPFIKSLVKAILMYTSYGKPCPKDRAWIQPRKNANSDDWGDHFKETVDAFLDICGSVFFPKILNEPWRHCFYSGVHPEWSSKPDRVVIVEGVRLLFESLRINRGTTLDLSGVEVSCSFLILKSFEDVLLSCLLPQPIEKLIQSGCDKCGGGDVAVAADGVYKCYRCEVNYHLTPCCGPDTPRLPDGKIICDQCVVADAAKAAEIARNREREASRVLAKAERDASRSASNTPKKKTPRKSGAHKKKSKLNFEKIDDEDEGDLMPEEHADDQQAISDTPSRGTGQKPNGKLRDQLLGKEPIINRKRGLSLAIPVFHGASPQVSASLHGSFPPDVADNTAPGSPRRPYTEAMGEIDEGYQYYQTPNDDNVHSRHSNNASFGTAASTTKKRPRTSDFGAQEPAPKRGAGATNTGSDRFDRPAQETDEPSQHIDFMPAKTPEVPSRLSQEPTLHGTPEISPGQVGLADTQQVKGVLDEGMVANILGLCQEPKFMGLTQKQINGTTLLLRSKNIKHLVPVGFNEITSPDALFDVCGSRYTQFTGKKATTRLLWELPDDEGWVELAKNSHGSYVQLIERILADWQDGQSSLYIPLLALYDDEVV